MNTIRIKGKVIKKTKEKKNDLIFGGKKEDNYVVYGGKNCVCH